MNQKEILLDRDPDEEVERNNISSIVAIYWKDNDKKIGIASYDELSNEIMAECMATSLEDIGDTFEHIKAVTNPTLFLLHPRFVANQQMLDLLMGDSHFFQGTSDSEDREERIPPLKYLVLKSSVWNSETALDFACSKLIVKEFQVRGPERSNKSTHNTNAYELLNEGRNPSIFRSNYLNLSSTLEDSHLRSAFGALLSYLQSHIFNLEGGYIHVSNIRSFPQSKYLRIDAHSLRALQIFSTELHPNVLSRSGKDKEGFSLFSLFDRTRSLPGRYRLKEWMSKPLYEKDMIWNRQNGVEMVLRPQNRDFISDTTKLLRHVHDIPRLLMKFKKGEASLSDWFKLYTTLEKGLSIMDLITSFVRDATDCNHHAADKEYLSNLISNFDFHAPCDIFHTLQVAIDFDSSGSEGHAVIKDGYDACLDQHRNIFDSLELRLTKACHQVLQVVPLLQNVSVEYVSQIGYLVAVSEEENHFLDPYIASTSNSQGMMHSASYDSIANTKDVYPCEDNNDISHQEDMTDTGNLFDYSGENNNYFRFIYEDNGIFFYKHRIVADLDVEIGDIRSIINDRQRALLREIEDCVLDAEYSLQHLSNILSIVDAIISLGAIASEGEFCRPEITDDSLIVVKNGRHLLQALTVDTFVPNDTFLSPEKNLALITGPNSSGKSVYLKQVGLLVYLAHIGSFVPAEKAIIGLTDRILTRVSAVETVTKPLSSFASDLAQMRHIFLNHTSKSLCLIDEFGKGTSPIDGISLLGGCIRHFLESRSRAIFALHFTEVFQKDIIDLDQNPSIIPLRMETISESSHILDKAENSKDSIDNEFVPLYRLRLGVATSSEGFPCAKLAGVSETVLQRAAELKVSIQDMKTINMNPLCLRKDPLQSESMKEILKKFLQCYDWENASKPMIDEIIRMLLIY